MYQSANFKSAGFLNPLNSKVRLNKVDFRGMSAVIGAPHVSKR